MTNKEILSKAIRKCAPILYSERKVTDIGISYLGQLIRIDIYFDGMAFPSISVPYEVIIFSHRFAKAFWGEEVEDKYIMRYSDIALRASKISRWKYYLQQMVLEEKPLKYLEKFLDE